MRKTRDFYQDIKTCVKQKTVLYDVRDGIATTTPPVQLVGVKVKVPVAVPCKAPTPQRPLFAVDGLPLGFGIWDQMKVLRVERWQRQGYGDRA